MKYKTACAKGTFVASCLIEMRRTEVYDFLRNLKMVKFVNFYEFKNSRP